MDISIIVPTYGNDNNIRRLDKTLSVFEHQDIIDNITFEVVVVDNGGSLNKEKVLEEHPYISNLVVVKEPKVGLSGARNKGVLIARGDIIAFTDDDIIPSKKWLGSLYRSYIGSGALCVGGPVEFQDNKNVFPSWFSDYFLRFLFPPKFPEKFDVITKPFFLIGANMSFKKEVFKKYGLFDTSLGRKGRCLLLEKIPSLF